jgi:hypothetical protein
VGQHGEYESEWNRPCEKNGKKEQKNIDTNCIIVLSVDSRAQSLETTHLNPSMYNPRYHRTGITGRRGPGDGDNLVFVSSFYEDARTSIIALFCCRQSQLSSFCLPISASHLPAANANRPPHLCQASLLYRHLAEATGPFPAGLQTAVASR